MPPLPSEEVCVNASCIGVEEWELLEMWEVCYLQQLDVMILSFSLKDQPAVALPSTTMSRREFRRLHFIAKEDEEEEEDVI